MKGKSHFFEDNRQLLKTVLAVAVPIMIQNGFTSFVNLLDNIMVGRLGTEQMSGVAIVNQILFVYNLCIFGGLSGAGIFTAQYFGKNDNEGIRNTFRFKFLLALTVSAVAILVFTLFGSSLINLYLSDSAEGGDLVAALSYGKEYLNIMIVGLPVFALVQTYSSTLRECGQTVVPMKAGVAAVLVNLLFNYLLIFGSFGFPALGVRGAAIATVLSRFVELSVVASWTHKHTSEVSFANGLYRTLRVPSHLVSEIMKKGMILLLNEALWSLGLSLVNQCFSTRGLNAVAGTNIASTLDNLFKVVFLAFGNSVGIIVGRLLGSGKMEEARETDTKIIGFSVFFSALVGLIMLSLAKIFPQIYNTTDSARTIATSIIIVQAICMPIEAFKNATYFTLRSGGRTFITFLFDGFSTITVNFPIAYILSRYTDASVLWIFISVQIGGLVKAILGFILVKKGVWIRNIVKE